MPPSETTIDGQLELKKRARRRLVGAAALALLAAIVLPMVMDHEPRQPAQEVQVRIPGQEAGGLVSRVLPKKPESTPLPPAEPDSSAEPKSDTKIEPKAEAKPPQKADAKADEKIEPKSDAKPKAVEKPETKPEAKPKVVEKPAAKAAEKPAEKPVAKPESKSEESKALAALAGKNADGAKWVVQLGAYKEEGRVRILQDKVKEMNIPVHIEKVETAQGTRTRVRAGPFKSREAAEQAQAKIRRIGVDGSVSQQ
jgi:DedD protein